MSLDFLNIPFLRHICLQQLAICDGRNSVFGGAIWEGNQHERDAPCDASKRAWFLRMNFGPVRVEKKATFRKNRETWPSIDNN